MPIKFLLCRLTSVFVIFFPEFCVLVACRSFFIFFGLMKIELQRSLSCPSRETPAGLLASGEEDVLVCFLLLATWTCIRWRRLWPYFSGARVRLQRIQNISLTTPIISY